MTPLSGETATISDEKFPQFEVVSDFSDHYYANRQQPELWNKRIMLEWKLLSKELPESIYVRAYETRVDLLRAAIVGVDGTPYRNGLFFFDIAFPSDYPWVAPLVRYRSFGYLIGEDFTKDGHICISLLNTSPPILGNKDERWNPKHSTIFQVLLSMQALVLQKGSIEYNAEVFVMNCKTMLRVLREPPENFELLVKQHFNDRAESILMDYDVFRKVSSSGLWKKKMNRLYGDLVRALARHNGASIPHYFLQQVMEEENAQAALAASKKMNKAKGGIHLRHVGKILIRKLKKIILIFH